MKCIHAYGGITCRFKWHPMAEKCDYYGTESLPVHLSRLHHPLAYKMMCKQSKAMIKLEVKLRHWKSETKFNKINNNITVQSVHCNHELSAWMTSTGRQAFTYEYNWSASSKAERMTLHTLYSQSIVMLFSLWVVAKTSFVLHSTSWIHSLSWSCMFLFDRDDCQFEVWVKNPDIKLCYCSSAVFSVDSIATGTLTFDITW